MRNLLSSTKVRLSAVFAGAFASLVGVVGLAGATADPALTSASDSATSYFTDNLPVIIGGFIAVAGVLWMFHLLFKSVGLKRKGTVG